jgi:hypothetical protein
MPIDEHFRFHKTIKLALTKADIAALRAAERAVAALHSLVIRNTRTLTSGEKYTTQYLSGLRLPLGFRPP